MKFKTREKVGTVLKCVASFGLGTLGGTAASAVTTVYCDYCGLGKAPKVALLALNGLAAWCCINPIVDTTRNAIDYWVYSAPDYDPMASCLIELEDRVAQEETEAE